MSRRKVDSARVDERKLEAFLDFVARMVARRWIRDCRDRAPGSSSEPDGSKTSSAIPESEANA